MTQLKVTRGNYSGYDVPLLSGGAYDFGGNDISNLDDISFTYGQDLLSTTAGLGFLLPSGDIFEIYFNSVVEFGFSSTELDIKSNDIIGVDEIKGDTTTNIIRSNSDGWDILMDSGASLDLVFNGVINYSFDEDRMFIGNSYIEIIERGDPSAPSSNRGLIYMRDNGSGKTQFVARFPTGAIQVIATEP